jgi:hypothetical protein
VARGRGWSAEVLRAREGAQWSCESKKAAADVVLTNDDPDGLDQKIDWFFGFLASGQKVGPSLPEGVTIASEPGTRTLGLRDVVNVTHSEHARE